jgi:hypothetical protein
MRKTDPTPPRRDYLRSPQKPAKRGCDKQEEATADALDGTLTRGSGSSTRPQHKGDVLSEYVRAECKTTGKLSLPIERAWLEKIRSEALMTGDAPMLVFGFDASDRKPREDWAAFPLTHAKNMSRALAALLAGDFNEARRHAKLIVGRNAPR